MTKSLNQKLVEAKRNFPAIIKDVSGYGYKYATLAQVIEAISIPLWDAGLDFYQLVKENKMTTGVIDLETGTKLDLVEFDIISASIQKANEIQQFGGGITYLRRYSLQNAFNLASEDDDGASGKNPIDKSKQFKNSENQEPIKKLVDAKAETLRLADEFKLRNLAELLTLKAEAAAHEFDADYLTKLNEAVAKGNVRDATATELINKLKAL